MWAHGLLLKCQVGAYYTPVLAPNTSPSCRAPTSAPPASWPSHPPPCSTSSVFYFDFGVVVFWQLSKEIEQ